MSFSSVNRRVYRLEEICRQLGSHSGKNDVCHCPWGEQSFYFHVEGLSEEETEKLFPGNSKTCHRCGGLNQVVEVDQNAIKED